MQTTIRSGLRGTALAVLALASAGVLTQLPTAKPAEWEGSQILDTTINQAIEDGITPGAVAWIESRGQLLHFASYGAKSVAPRRESMELDTIFDCASLTKVIVTAPAIMMLAEEGKVRLNDNIQVYLPDFQDRTRITVLQLLTHFSGLRPTLPLESSWRGYQAGVDLALQERPTIAPGTKFIYSDVNYILLAEIVRRVTGTTLDKLAEERIFEPLGMDDTSFRPAAELRSRIAPTVQLADGSFLRGIVHDPTTRRMAGVSGQAGVFSTARDVAAFARMMLNGGELDGTRILSPLSVLRMRTSQSPDGAVARGIGWDIDTPYSSPRGDLFSTASFGHTGYTGPSLWIDPVSHSFVVLMTNRVHPADKTSVVRLRSLVATVVAANLGGTDPSVRADQTRDRAVFSPVKTGLDVLASEGFARLRGKKIGLLTNHTGIDRLRRRNIDLLTAAPDVSLESIFTPEHGLGGELDQPDIADGVDQHSGVAVHSLYRSDRKRPTTEQLRGLDALVFDIQDIGARFYTYITTMGYALEAAAEAGIEFYVLDRPNPINGTDVEGPQRDDELESFVAYHNIPVRHGMTVGELAGMFDAEREIGAKLEVVRMQGWERSLWFDETGLPWVNPSPNIRTLDQAILYPGIAMLEQMPNYSVGRGTDTPFQFVGADWIDGVALADAIRRASLPGIRVYTRRQKPTASVFSGTVIDGVQFSITDRNALQPTRLGLVIASALAETHANKVDFERAKNLVGNLETVDALNNGQDTAAIWSRIDQSISDFRTRRRAFLLY
ncbi:MAG: DUF1343 domain-containing protein [Bryobacterales bacterium]|nr:DUF1343 domain-containing protein [Bryobacterales bacterium]MDE0622149.1 DUF1343 domain-containing protein [Bryobacterales bacterium]